MKISESWLRSWVDPAISTAELAEQLTMAGLEIDGVEELGGNLDQVVVGEIVAVDPHPDAEKLRVCTVNCGDEGVQIVCGAPNARVGLKAPLAKVGAVLPAAEGEKPIKIKQAKLRGVSSMGMLCAQQELGLGSDDDGLWELPEQLSPGTALSDALDLPDTVLEVDLTPNRSDCLSVAGVAREVGVLNRLAVSEPAIEPAPIETQAEFPVSVEASADCPRYLGRVIEGVDLTRSTPGWMQQRLERAGMRSIDPAVDVTNYVMLELGQPLHAFDLDTLSGGIVVRHANAGEKMTLLDESSIDLNDSCLLIADQDKPLALAGIMGGLGSGVQPTTTRLMLESAHFTPAKIAGRARHFGLHTESSHRFERGVDPELPEEAMQRATALLLEIVGGQAGPITEVASAENLPAPAVIQLRRAQIERLLGFSMADDDVADILGRLGFDLQANDEGWQVTATSARFDIAIEADLLEELARIHGYNRLPVKPARYDATLAATQESAGSVQRLREQLCALDYQEAITYSFIDPAVQQQFFETEPTVSVRNPISSEMSVMRTSLLPGLVQALSHNINRQHTRVRLFETGQCFLPVNDELRQVQRIAGVLFGPRESERWNNDKSPVDFYDVKGHVEQLFSVRGALDEVSISAGEHSALHPGQCATIDHQGQKRGTLGALHPRLVRQLDLPGSVFLFEIDLEFLLQGNLPSYEKVSKFPEVRRDLAIFLQDHHSLADVTASVRQSAGQLLSDLIVFDVYAGKGVPEGEKSLGLGLTLQDHSSTLTDAGISACLEQIVSQLEQQFGARLRN